MNEYDIELNDLRLRAESKGIYVLDCFNDKTEIIKRISLKDFKKILDDYEKIETKKKKEIEETKKKEDEIKKNNEEESFIVYRNRMR